MSLSSSYYASSESRKQLINLVSQDLETYISEAPSGVIYFSLGSMIKATSISKERLAAMQRVFSELPQRVLWKWENDTMDGKPDNVMIRKWLPQMDILSE